MGFVFENLLIRDCRYCTCKCNASGCSSNILAACQGADWEAFGAQHYLALFTLSHILLLPSLPPWLTQFSTSSLETDRKNYKFPCIPSIFRSPTDHSGKFAYERITRLGCNQNSYLKNGKSLCSKL